MPERAGCRARVGSVVLALALTCSAGLEAGDAPPPAGKSVEPTPLPGTAQLDLKGDIASNLVAGVDRFLLHEIGRAKERRGSYWHADFSSPQAYEQSVATNRARLAEILGVRDKRTDAPVLNLTSRGQPPKPLAQDERVEVWNTTWPVFPGVNGEGLLLLPKNGAPIADAIVVPDADETPEAAAGLVPNSKGAATPTPTPTMAWRLAESGCRVLIPCLIDRATGEPKSRFGTWGEKLSNREFLYRPGFELGRHLIGLELQRIFAGLDALRNPGERPSVEPGVESPSPIPPTLPCGIFGRGEGGMLAFYAGALDTRFVVTGVSGWFGRREEIWTQPIERNVFGLLERFGDAETALLIAPRSLVVEAAKGPEIEVPYGTSGAPGRLTTPALADVRAEFADAQRAVATMRPAAPKQDLVVSGDDGKGPPGSENAIQTFLHRLKPEATLHPAPATSSKTLNLVSPGPDPARRKRQLRELDDYLQQILVDSPRTRQKFFEHLDTSSPGNYAKTSAQYRDTFEREAIGRFDTPMLEANPKSRKAYEEDGWTGYEVALDVFPDVIAYGILLLPSDLKPGERRPVVVCQHGLEGRPQDVIGQPGFEYYKAFAATLAKRGFITFAPQNLYIFTDRFRSLQRKANPLGKTLFSIIIPQHRQILAWLKTQPFVDPERIGFYGLSYGGKSAMRIPAAIEDYALSICSADFNEWVWKNASTHSPYSYVWTGEYEIFEWNLGDTFNYAEMAALIAPRPFMVERGHFDGVAPDETVAYEFAKVRHLYAARLGLGDRCEMETFVGPHTINGKGTFDFLHRHLAWPPPKR